jgi:putative ABC transport system permease protein
VTNADLVREAWDSLVAHRLRTLLAILGIVAGVGTIVAALAITGGARQQALADIGALGIDNLLIRAVPDTAAHARPRAPALTLDDAAAVAVRFPRATVSALRPVRDTAVVSDVAVAITVAGVTSEWRQTARLALTEGRWFDADSASARTAVMNQTLARIVFHGEAPIGQQVLAAGEWRTVVGVLADGTDRRASHSIQGLDLDRTIFVPIGSLDVPLGDGDAGDAVDQIVMRMPAGTDVARSAPAVTALLAARHIDDQAAFEVVIPQELLRTRLRAQRGFHALLFSIGGLALLISGVGIMNIMVASVTERAAEIGVRRAFGARRSNVVLQFAAEAALLSAAGGLMGVTLGMIAVAAVAQVAGWPVAVSPEGLIASLGLALGVGLAAGAYPAHLAATLPPTEALRQ